MSSEVKAPGIVGPLDAALAALGRVLRLKAPVRGLGTLQRRIEREIAGLERARDHFKRTGSLEVRGTASGGEKERQARISGKRYGGRPPREAMLRVLSENKDSSAKLRRMPARALLYARQQTASVEDAVTWLGQPQVEFGGEAPLHIDRRLQRKYARRLALEPRST